MTTEYDRLPFDAESYDEVWQYYAVRALQLATRRYVWSRVLTPVDGGYLTSYTREGETFGSFYVIKSQRGKGKAELMAQMVAPHRIVTITDCHVAKFFESKNIPHVVEYGMFDTDEYKAIESEYGNQRAKRSRVHLMNHIDEGLVIMHRLGASVTAQKAYCLHPLLQNDADLFANFDPLRKLGVNSDAMMLALEYRNQANQWLSDKVTLNDDTLSPYLEEHGKPTTGPLPGVRAMLIADKVQNYKDFIAHHKGKHRRSIELDHYFKVWLRELGVDNFDQWVDDINSVTNPA